MGDRAQRSHKGAFVERSNAALNSMLRRRLWSAFKQLVGAREDHATKVSQAGSGSSLLELREIAHLLIEDASADACDSFKFNKSGQHLHPHAQ